MEALFLLFLMELVVTHDKQFLLVVISSGGDVGTKMSSGGDDGTKTGEKADLGSCWGYSTT